VMKEETIDLFLCHSGTDDTWVRMLAERIEKQDFGGTRRMRAFYDDRDIVAGQRFVTEMLLAIRAARYVALVMSPEFFESEYISMEVAEAWSTKPLVPIFLRDIPLRIGRKLEELPIGLRHLKYLDFRIESHFEDRFADLVTLLRGAAPATDPEDVGPRKQGLVDLVRTAMAIAVGGDKEPETTYEFSTLEEAFVHVQSCVALVVAKAPDPRRLGVAWVIDTGYLFCAPSVAKEIEIAIGNTCTVEIASLAKSNNASALNWVRAVSHHTSPLPDLARLQVFPRGWWPRPPELVWTKMSPPTTDEPLGALRLTSADDLTDSAIDLARVAVNEWRVRGGTLLLEPPGATLLFGTPLFDRAARIVGFLADTEPGGLTAIPLSRHRF
jgi:TIR domain-containing protein